MARASQEQLVALTELGRRMRALGVRYDGYPDTRANGDVFITFRIEDLLPLIGLAEDKTKEENNVG